MTNSRKREKRQYILRKFGEKIKETISYVELSRITGINESTIANFYQNGTGGKGNIIKICNALGWNVHEIFTDEEWAIINRGRNYQPTLEEGIENTDEELDETEENLFDLDEDTNIDEELEEERRRLILKTQIINAFAEYYRFESEKLLKKYREKGKDVQK